jgi:CheY-like chemotaxis protein
MNNDTTKGKILLVDDDKFLADMYSLKFTDAGYSVHACLSFDDAIATLKGGFDPKAVIFDIMMPMQDGFSFLKRLSDEHLVPEALRIALTNQSDDADKERAMSLGANRYLVKATMVPSEVVNIVEEEIAKLPAK